MEVENIRITKLVNGDTIISGTQRAGGGHTIIVEPIQMMTVPNPTGGLRQVMLPWMEGSDALEFTIPDFHILTMATPRKEVLEVYENYIVSKKFSEAEQEYTEKEEQLVNVIEPSEYIH